MLALLANVGPAQGAELVDVPDAVTLPAAGPLEIDIVPRDGRPLRVQLERSPVGVELARSVDNGWTLSWTAPDRRFDSTVVLNASPADDPSARERFTIELRARRTSGDDTGTETHAGEATESAAVASDTPDAFASRPSRDESAEGRAGPLSLPMVRPQTLQVGRPWELWLRAEGMPADAVDLGLRGAPPGLTLTAGTNGWHRLSFTPRVPGSVDLEVIATARRDAMVEARRPIALTIEDGDPLDGRPPDPAPQATLEPPGIPDADQPPPSEPGMERSLPAPSSRPAPDAARVDAPDGLSEGATDDDGEGRLERLLEAPTLKSMSNHVVSAGRAVRFRVRPSLGDGQRAIVQIDRLPRNASFDENDDGSRTFHWPTADRDQGEHRFRLTAINAEDASLRDEIEVTVIVGDPSRGKTVPAEPRRR